MLHSFCQVATDFPTLLRELRDPLKLRASEVIVQFPFTLPVTEEKTEEELAKMAEKRKEQGKKLQEMAAKMRVEKVRFIVSKINLANKLVSYCKKRPTCSILRTSRRQRRQRVNENGW